MAFDRSFPQSLASQAIANSEHFWPRLRFSPLRLKNAASFGSRDYDLRLPYAYSDPLPTSGGRTLQFAYGHKLSLTAALSLTPTPPAAPTVSARYRSTVNPMPPLAIPSRRCRVAALLPPFHADAILSATFLPPIEEEAAYIPSPLHVPFIHRLRRLYIALAGLRGFIAAGRWQCQNYRPHPEHGDCRLYEHSLRQSIAP